MKRSKSEVIADFKHKLRSQEVSVDLNLDHAIVESEITEQDSVVEEHSTLVNSTNRPVATPEEIAQWDSMVRQMGVREGNA